LTRAGIDATAVSQAMTDLERVGLVDDESFARDFAAHRLEGRREGVRAARSALRAKGLAPDLVERALEGAEEGEDERAEALAGARAHRLRSDPPDRALAKLTAFLQRRGYGYGTASRAARRALGTDVAEGLEPS
jgi:regulatory protein